MPELDINALNQIYSDSEQSDHDLFAEMRSNVQLVAGEHYAKRNSRFHSRIRDSKGLTSEQKLRLTKNHLYRIMKAYTNHTLTHSPEVAILPKNEAEMQDQKAAELYRAVMEDLKQKQNYRKRYLEFCKDFYEIGEVACKIFWDPNKGRVVGHEAEMVEDPMTGQMVPLTDPATGQLVPSKNAVFSGQVVVERILGFDLLRHPAAKTIDESPYLIYRKMTPVKDLKALIQDEEISKKIQESSKNTYMVFDGNTADYKQTKDMVMLREFYYRPCSDYPNGYFYIATEDVICFQGELPFGIYPIVYEGCDEIVTTPRHRSPIKQFRPYVAEIDRSASKIAEHQITLGDDKVLIQSGTNLEPGATLPGVRTMKYSGVAPTHLPGRTGEQYVTYMQSQIAELYQVAGLEDEIEQKDPGQMDPFALLYRSMKQKKKFAINGEKFQSFQMKFWETQLDLAKNYYTPENLVPAIGRNEYINIPEFKSISPLSHMIRMEPSSDDIETKMGKQLVFNHVLQYVGPQLDKEQVGTILRAMPYANKEEAFGTLTQDYDSLKNVILALDRGEQLPVNKHDTHKYFIKGLVNRQRQADYRYLDPRIQQLYDMRIEEHTAIDAEQLKEIQAAKDGFIPTGGYLVTVDFYVPDPASPAKTRRARVPLESMKWLMDRLETQGANMQEMERLQQSALSDLAKKVIQDKISAGQQSGGPGQVIPMQPQQMPQ